MELTSLLLFLWLSPVTQQSSLGWGEVCVYACMNSLTSVMFSTTKRTEDFYTGSCKDTLKYESTYVCSFLHCPKKEIRSGMSFINNDCVTEAGIEIPSYDAVMAKCTSEDISNMPVVGLEDISPTEIVNRILLPSQELFDMSYRTEWTWVYELASHRGYG